MKIFVVSKKADLSQFEILDYSFFVDLGSVGVLGGYMGISAGVNHAKEGKKSGRKKIILHKNTANPTFG